MTSIFLEVEKEEDFNLLNPFSAVLEDTPDGEKMHEIKVQWEALGEENKEESKDARDQRLTELLTWVCGSKHLLMAETPQKLEEVCHVLFYFLDDTPLTDGKEVLFENLARWLFHAPNHPEKQLEMCGILLNLIPECSEVASSRRDPEEQTAHNKRYGNCRGRVFSLMLEFAKDHKQGGLFRGLLSKEMYQKWFLEEDLYITLIDASYNLLKQTQDATWEAHSFLLEHLRKVPQNQTYACYAVVNVLSSEKNSPRDLMEVYSLQAVRSLNKTKYSPLYDLLRLLYEGNVDDYIAFLEIDENETAIDNLGLDKKEIMFKIQQLTLCDLGREQPLQDLSALQEKIKCESLYELEKVVQAAQRHGLLEALFDYSNNTLRLHKVALRVFRNNQECWEELSNKLQTWSTQTQTIYNFAMT